MANRDLTLVLKAKDEASRAVHDVEKAAHGLSFGLGGLGDRIAGLGIGLFGIQQAFSAVGGAVKGLIGDAIEAQKVEAQLDAVLKSTAGAAGLQKKELTEMADALSRVTMFDDEAIISGQSLLLTFTRIGRDIFPQATEAMLNMSQALGQDLKSSAIQLGKALNDPILGVTALRRVGVSFSEAQVDIIKNLVETGRLLEAQHLILAELEIEFGGAAKAAGDTFAGKLKILETQLGNVKEALGRPLLGALTGVLDKVIPLVGSIGRLGEIFGVIRSRVQQLTDIFGNFRGIRVLLIETFGPGTADILMPFVALMLEVTKAAGSLVTDIRLAFENSGIEGAIRSFFAHFTGPNVIGFLKEFGSFLLSVLDANFDRLVEFLKAHGPGFVETLFGEWIPAAIREMAKLLKALISWFLTDGAPQLAELGVVLGAALVRGILKGAANLGPDLLSWLTGQLRLLPGRIMSGELGPPGTLAIPQFQGGGIVPGPVGAPRVIIAHGGETVSPVGGGSVNINIMEGAYITPQAARELWEVIKREAGRDNSLVLAMR